MDSKQKRNRRLPSKVINIGNAKHIHIGDISIKQDPLCDTDTNIDKDTDNLLNKLIPMQMISNIYEELFTMWKERLMKHYKTDNAYMRSLFWKNKENDFLLKEYFVDLKVQKSKLLGFKTGEYVQLKDIFQKDVSHPVVILVTGDPGYGKTTLCKKIAYDWGEDDEDNDYLSHFDFVVVIVLRELKGKTVVNAILNKISDSIDDSYSTIKRELRRTKLNFLVILDGFDECFDKGSVINFIQNDSVEISKNMTILVTSRPYVAEEIREYVTDRFFLEGFSPEQQKIYIELVVKENLKMKNLLNLVNTNFFYNQLGKCPLTLHMLCCLSDSIHLENIKTRTDLYVRIFRLIIERYRKKKDVKHGLKKGKIFYGEKELTKLGELIYEKMCDKKACGISDTFITSEDLKRIFPIQQEYEFILSLDILSICFENDVNDVVYFDILHKTFTEFLLDLYFYNCFISIPCFQTNAFSPFLFGLFTNKVIPKNFIKCIKQFVTSPSMWCASYKEIKDKDNQELFRLNTKLLIRHGTLNDWKEFIQHFRFTQIYYFIPESKHFYELVRNELIQLYKTYNYSNELEIFLILDSSFSEDPSINPPTGFRDIRDIATMIKNLLNSYRWKKFKFYLFGIFPYEFAQMITLDKAIIHVFNKIENPAIISKEIRKELKIKSYEPIVSLHSVNKPFAISYYSFEEQRFKNEVERGSKEIQNLISAEIFENLKPYIKLDLEDQQV